MLFYHYNITPKLYCQYFTNIVPPNKIPKNIAHLKNICYNYIQIKLYEGDYYHANT